MARKNYGNDTIVALSSPPGRSGVGLIRVSGPQAIDIVNLVFRSRETGHIHLIDRHATYGFLTDPETSQVIDDGIAVAMRGPSSYTGEDVVELSLHGSPVILREAIRVIMSCGARLADRGEFTRRAFLSGRMDLVQAEAVIDLIDSESLNQAGEARSRIDRKLSGEIHCISSDLKDIAAEIEAFIDFDDDEDGLEPHPEEALQDVFIRMQAQLSASRSGQFIRKGLTAVITGKPNVGKSTLFNALLGADRMIISPMPGTTRDPVSERAYINGVAITLGDTAGVREQPDPIEREGIRRTREWVNNSDIAIVVLDSSRSLDSDDKAVIQSVGTKPKIIVLNKIDRNPGQPGIASSDISSEDVIELSAKTGTGLESLTARIGSLAELIQGSVEFIQQGSLNDRALLLMESARENVKKALELLRNRFALELVSLEIKSACDKIDEITGKKFTDDVLDRIFERFCVGK